MANTNTETAGDRANHVVETFKSNDTGAAFKELHDDMRGMSSADRKEFFHKLQGASQATKLPGLEITEDGKHQLKVSDTRDGKKSLLYDEAAEAKAQPSGKGQEPADKGQAPTDKGQEPTDKGQAPTDKGQPPADQAQPPANQEHFSLPLKRGEGPYQALHRTHPDWDHKKLLDESRRILSETGKKSFRQGESFQTNEDGSVTSRMQGQHGAFSDTTSHGGKVMNTRQGDGQGNWVSRNYDGNNHVTGSTEHMVNKEGGYTETQKGADGKPVSKVISDKDGNKNTETYDANGSVVSSIRENTDGTVIGNRKNADGSMASIEGDKNRTVETVTKDGKTVSTTTTEQNADGRKVTVEDDKGTLTKTYDKDNNQTSGMMEGKDGSLTGWKKNSDGSNTTIEQPDKDHRKETTTKDGKMVSEMTHEPTQNGGWKETTTGPDGKVTGTVTHDPLERGGWKETTTGPDGKVTGTKAHEVSVDGKRVADYQLDGQGKLIKSTEVEQQEYGKKVTTTDPKGRNLDGYDKDGNQVSGIRENNDGSSIGWRRTPDGHTTNFDKSSDGSSSEMTTDKDGHVVGTKQYDKKSDTTVEKRYEGGKIYTRTTVPGKYWGHNTTDTVEDGQPPRPDV